MPDEAKERLLEQHTPLVEYLAREIDIPYELVIPDSYEELERLFHAKNIDLAFFGGYTFIRASRFSQAVPLVMRDVDAHFTSCFLIHADSSARTIKDFEGKSFSFGPRLSTSGHLMPRHFLLEQGIKPEAFFHEVRYSEAHDKTALMVSARVVDLGVVNCQVVRRMVANGGLGSEEVRLLWETPPYVDYVWAIQPSIGKTAQIQIRDAFLGLSQMNREHAEILSEAGAGHFLPTSSADFVRLQQMIDELHLLEEP